MNKSVLKNFAVDSRKELIEKIQIKAMQYGIEKDKITKSQIQSSDSVVINGEPLSKEEKQQREKLIDKIKSINEDGGDGYKQVIEEVAYTWFNRFTALRFMEVNDYLPTRVRALSSTTIGSVEPELIKEASNVDLKVDRQKIYDMKLSNDTEGLFKYMIIAQCNNLNKTLPFMFEKIGHYTELLFPDGLFNEGAFIRRLTDVELITESDWEDVEIIGWLYQYYISEEKDRVIQAKSKYKKNEIPFATQLFTPDWIVRYMVQNTLGRYWVESHPEHSDLKNNWEFYLENPNPEQDFKEKLKPNINKELRVEDIKCFDPAMGSGHILVYMFDVLYEIYEKCGYICREIPQLIIENNLYGLDIDDRAYQLACFAVIMKGMKYNNRLLRSIQRDGIRLNIASIQETTILNNDDIVYIAGEASGENYNKTKAFIEQFKNAKIYGSLIRIEGFDEVFFNKRLEYIMNNPAENIMLNENRKKIVEILPELVKQLNIMVKTYDILATNPPYMGSNYMNEKLSTFIKRNYGQFKADVFSSFIAYCLSKVSSKGHLGFLSPFVWMFLSAYSDLREVIINNTNISSLIQLEYNAFSEACVPVCTFTLRNNSTDLSGEYIKLSNFPGSEIQEIKTLEAIKEPNVKYRYSNHMNNYKKIPNIPIAYWISDQIAKLFKNEIKIKEVGQLKSGTSTSGQNDELFRFWHEINYNKIQFGAKHYSEVKNKWIPLNKGGSYRRWYGNLEYVSDNSFCPKNNNEFDLAITWSDINSHYFSARVHLEGVIANNVGKRVYVEENYFNYLLGFLNTIIAGEMLDLLIPTLHFDVGYVGNLPVVVPKKEVNEKICKLVEQNIYNSKNDWDSFEISWNFKTHPLLIYRKDNNKMERAFNNWADLAEMQFYQLKQNEEELNRIFIDIYGLQNEMIPEVEGKDISVRKADRDRDIKSFVSYAVGCIFGRYSLDQDGLVYAGGNFDYSKYCSIPVDEDNILPILSDGYFKDDIVSKFIEFVQVTFGEETLPENLDYIADTLGRKNNETTKDTIRRYFLTDFYKDHLQTYKNRPIYWMFTSGKQKAFNCMIYMHRYDKTTLSRIRTDYLHELQDRLDAERKALVDVIEGDYSTKEKSEAKKKLVSLDKQIDELKKYDEVLHHMADMQIDIDLDDGVVVNYEKFKHLLVKI